MSFESYPFLDWCPKKGKVGREMDFVILENYKPIQLIETKLSDSEISRGLVYLKERYPQVRALQVHLKGKKEYISTSKVDVLNVIHLFE